MASINDIVKDFFEGLSDDALEERVVEYIVRELHKGRSLTEVLDDPYVRNRLNDEKVKQVVGNADLIAALESQISESFKAPDLGFSS
ncbi:MAG: hypothetical protein FDZ75_06605 [Actinobacteria bacterium]|nr:MAG: hypothetical protein FDZ75_06605 [Actinomycetota bacterium]